MAMVLTGCATLADIGPEVIWQRTRGDWRAVHAELGRAAPALLRMGRHGRAEM